MVCVCVCVCGVDDSSSVNSEKVMKLVSKCEVRERDRGSHVSP